MALHAFGPAVDIQAGGGDLRFPPRLPNGHGRVVHRSHAVRPGSADAGVVHVSGAKMAKSTGNLVLVSDLLAEYPPGLSGC